VKQRDGVSIPSHLAGAVSERSPAAGLARVDAADPNGSRRLARWGGRDWAGVALLLAVGLALWLPRLSGPLDMRFDAGVYYLLGTSLSEGKGYRLLNEPGEIHAIQYPPVLPLAAAIAQRVAGTTAVGDAGHLLRVGFFLCYLLYACAVYLLARHFLSPGAAVVVGLLTLLHESLTRHSDNFFAELPLALVAVVFAVVLRRADRHRGWAFLTGLLAVTAYLVRTMGLALLVAWVGEALLRRRWTGAARRAAIALIPVLAWQGYIAHVKASPEYAHPAYPYQRADYQYYNVGYLENLSYVHSFAPALGKASAGDWARRVGGNLMRMPTAFGETLAAAQGWWLHFARKLDRHARISGGLSGALAAAFAAVLKTADLVLPALGWLAILGLIFLMRQGEWFTPLYVAGTVLLASLTPWPEQFLRYFLALAPFLAIGALLAIVHGWRSTRRLRAAGRPQFAAVLAAAATAATLVVSLGLTVETYSQIRLMKSYQPAAYADANGRRHTQRLFYYYDGWRSYEGALGWLAAHAGTKDVIASQAPQWTYLMIGRKSVFPPAEADPDRAQRLLDAVPVAYLVLDRMEFNQISAKEARAVVDAHPERWRLVYETPDSKTLVYRRLDPAGKSS
jgi:hypothetical protein